MEDVNEGIGELSKKCLTINSTASLIGLSDRTLFHP